MLVPLGVGDGQDLFPGQALGQGEGQGVRVGGRVHHPSLPLQDHGEAQGVPRLRPQGGVGEAHLHHLAHVGPPPPEVGGGGRQDPSPVPVGVAHRHTLPVPHLVQVQGDPLLQGKPREARLPSGKAAPPSSPGVVA